MQVGITRHKASSLAPTPPQRRSVNAANAVQGTDTAHRIQGLDFPDPLLISSRPLRYNVEFNRQVTAVQQADDFLGRAESGIVTLRHTINHGTSPEIIRQAQQLTRLLDNRPALSGHSVDRALRVTLTAPPQVGFRLAAAETLLNNPQAETLIFSLSNEGQDMAACTLPAEGEPQQRLRPMRQCLGRLGIATHGDTQHAVTFSVSEESWPRVRDRLAVRGEGKRFTAERFTALDPVPDTTLQDSLKPLIAHPQQARAQLKALHQALEHISGQREQLALNREQIRSTLNGMETFKEQGAALLASSRLGNRLAEAAAHFSTLSQALNGQANARPTTVKNLLRG